MIPGFFHLAFLYFMPSILPSLFLLPLFVVGMPVILAIFRFAFVIPKARFRLKDRPGIADFLLAIYSSPSVLSLALVTIGLNRFTCSTRRFFTFAGIVATKITTLLLLLEYFRLEKSKNQRYSGIFSALDQ